MKQWRLRITVGLWALLITVPSGIISGLVSPPSGQHITGAYLRSLLWQPWSVGVAPLTFMLGFLLGPSYLNWVARARAEAIERRERGEPAA